MLFRRDRDRYRRLELVEREKAAKAADAKARAIHLLVADCFAKMDATLRERTKNG